MSISTEAVEVEERVLGALVSPDEANRRLRIVDAALRCVAIKGLRGTTVEEIASEAGIARATLYRTFPGGRDAVLAAVADTESARFFASMTVALAGADDLESLLVRFMTGVTRRLTDSTLIAAMWAEQPETLFSRVAFDGLDATLALASDFAWPFFGQWMDEDPARRAAEFAVRVVLSYLLSPSQGVDLTDEASARALIERHVLAGVEALAA